MKHCRKWQETLWLDVYGELSPEVRLEWERHLEGCRPCDQERTRLFHLLKRVNESMPEPELSPEDTGALYNDIIEKLKKEHFVKTGRRKSFFDGYIKPIYAMAACCLLIVAFGWFGLREYQQTSRIGTISELGGQEQVIVKEIDLLENLELLEEMDTLEKLDQVLKS